MTIEEALAKARAKLLIGRLPEEERRAAILDLLCEHEPELFDELRRTIQWMEEDHGDRTVCCMTRPDVEAAR